MRMRLNDPVGVSFPKSLMGAVFRFVFLSSIMALVQIPQAALAENHVAVKADATLVESGLLEFILPRFSLKTGVRADRSQFDGQAHTTIEPSANEVLILALGGSKGIPVSSIDETASVRRVFTGPQPAGQEFAVIYRSEPADSAQDLVDWLVSDVGRRTVSSFEINGVQAFLVTEASVEEEIDLLFTGDVAAGEQLSLQHCGRCHVINESNKMGGLGSAPAFATLRANSTWQDRFQTFFVRNPHPSFTQITDVTEPFPPNLPPPIVPVEITLDDLEAILAFVSHMKPADLGAEISPTFFTN